MTLLFARLFALSGGVHAAYIESGNGNDIWACKPLTFQALCLIMNAVKI